MPSYFVCPNCGHKQRSKAKKRIKCHDCGRSYQRKKAKKVDSKVQDLTKDEKRKAKFHTYEKEGKNSEK